MKVLLPAPFSPISACTSPASARKAALLSAVMPPNRLVTAEASRRAMTCYRTPSAKVAQLGKLRRPVGRTHGRQGAAGRNLGLGAGSLFRGDLDPGGAERQRHAGR